MAASALLSEEHADDVVGSEGIRIPAFLQPLFGLDFVPFLPSSHRSESFEDVDLRVRKTSNLTNTSYISSDGSRSRSSTNSSSSNFVEDEGDAATDAALQHPQRHVATTATQIANQQIEEKHDDDTSPARIEAPKTIIVPKPTIQNKARASIEKEKEAETEHDHHRLLTLISPSKKKKIKRRLQLKNLLRGKRNQPNGDNGPKSGATTAAPNRSLLKRALVPNWGSHDSEPSHDPLMEEESLADSDEVNRSFGEVTAVTSVDTVVMSQQQPQPQRQQERFSIDWLEQQQVSLDKHQHYLKNTKKMALDAKNRSIVICDSIANVADEIEKLQKALRKANKKLQHHIIDLDDSQLAIKRLEKQTLSAAQHVAQTISTIQEGLSTDTTPPPPALQTFSTISIDDTKTAVEPESDMVEDELEELDSNHHELVEEETPRSVRSTPPNCPSFMRIHDLDVPRTIGDEDEPPPSTSSDSKSISTTASGKSSPHDLFYIDHGIVPLLDKLFQRGFKMAINESDAAFTPTKDTHKSLQRYQKSNPKYLHDHPNWLPKQVWHSAQGNDVLIWTGQFNEKGFGSNWPVCKGRALIRTTPRTLLELLMDSTQTKKYNKMSQGRQDLHVLQDDLDITAEESQHGFAGAAKITKSLNKPKLIPKTIEMTSLMHARPLSNGAYMSVSRAVFDDSSGQSKNPNGNIQTEMLLGVLLLRPANPEGTITELTTVTHVVPTGVPEMLAKRAAPSQAANAMRDIQAIYKT